MRKAILVVLLGWSVVGCEPVHHYNRTQVAVFQAAPKRPYGSVRVFQTAEEVKRPYEVVGLLTCDGEAAEEAGILNAMLYRAAELGADGLLLNPAKSAGDDPNSGTQKVNVRINTSPFFGDENKRVFRAHAIKFRE